MPKRITRRGTQWIPPDWKDQMALIEHSGITDQQEGLIHDQIKKAQSLSSIPLASSKLVSSSSNVNVTGSSPEFSPQMSTSSEPILPHQNVQQTPQLQVSNLPITQMKQSHSKDSVGRNKEVESKSPRLVKEGNILRSGKITKRDSSLSKEKYSDKDQSVTFEPTVVSPPKRRRSSGSKNTIVNTSSTSNGGNPSGSVSDSGSIISSSSGTSKTNVRWSPKKETKSVRKSTTDVKEQSIEIVDVDISGTSDSSEIPQEKPSVRFANVESGKPTLQLGRRRSGVQSESPSPTASPRLSGVSPPMSPRALRRISRSPPNSSSTSPRSSHYVHHPTAGGTDDSSN